MNRPLIRVGDKTSHGGEVLSGSPNFIVDGKQVARLGDQVSCPQCKAPTVVASASATYITDGQGTARDGDKTGCGAVLIASQTVYLIE